MGKYNKVEKHRKEIIKKPSLPLGNPIGSSKNKDHNYIPPNRFYTEKEEVNLRFYQTPKALFKNPKYAGLSLGAKLMYPVLLDKAEVLRDVFKFLKEKKLTGDQSLNLIRLIKNQPRLTVEESYRDLLFSAKTKEKQPKDQVEAVISASDKLSKAIEKLDMKKLNKDITKSVKDRLMETKLLIERILTKL
jgi:hypothetical protein